MAEDSYWHDGDHLVYQVLDEEAKTCRVVNYNNQTYHANDLILPTYVWIYGEKYSLVAIGDYAFNMDHKLYSITIPNTVKTIGKGAFQHCEHLRKVDMPNSIVSIEENAFYYCEGLESIKIPNSVEYIGEAAFKGCYTIKSIVMEDLEDENADSPLISFGYETFAICYELETVKLSNRVSSIGMSAFRNCEKLSSVDLPNTLKTIGNGAFKYCYSLQYLTLPNSLTRIEDNAFAVCGILSIDIPDSVTHLGKYAFNQSLLQSVKLSNSITEISEGAFFVCKHLKEVELPSTLSSIGGNAFDECESLRTIKIPNSVKYIGWNSFAFTSLESVEIPDSVTHIDSRAFGDCHSLKSVTMSNSVTKINKGAFSDCQYLESITLPEVLTYLGEEAFENCSALKEVKIPENIEYLGKNTFSGCDYIREIFYLAEEPKEFDKSVFSQKVYDKATLYTNQKATKQCKTLDPWQLFKNIKAFGNVSVESIALNLESVQLKVGESVILNALVLPEEATDKSIEWSSDSPTIASIDQNGTVTAFALGSATITASCGEVSATCTVTVVPTPVESITLSKDDAQLKVGEIIALTATVIPEDATDKTVTWTSDNAEVASVDENGNVIAVALGSANITAACGEVNATCNVTVVATPVESITLSQEYADLTVGEHLALSAIVLPESATNKEILWSSSDPAVAGVDSDGNVTAINVGIADIIASCGEVSAICHVTVNPVLVEAILLTPDNWSGEEGESFKIETTVLPENATDTTLEWSTSDANVAEVDGEGNVTVLHEGTCVITASAADGSGIYAECVVTGLAGIDAIFAEDSSDVEIYDMNGILRKKGCNRDDLKKLTPGIYIIRSGNMIEKVVIR